MLNTSDNNKPHIHWHTDLDAIPGQPVVAGDLLLIPVQASGRGHVVTLYAFDLATGVSRWQQAFEHAFISGLSAADDLLFISLTSTDLLHGAGALLAVDPATGEALWRWPGAARDDAVQRVSAPAVREGAVVVTVDARQVVVLDLATGAERAVIPVEARFSLAAPALDTDVAYVPCKSPHLLAVDLAGDLRWRYTDPDADAWLDKTPIVLGERLYAVLSVGAVVALDTAAGAVAWRVAVGPAGKALSPPATDGERLYVGARDGTYALALDDGRELWRVPTERRIAAAPVVHRGGVYAAGHDHHVRAVDAVSGKVLWSHKVARRLEVAPVVAVCGDAPPCVIIADRGGTITALECPLDAEELEAAGRWFEAARMREALGESERAAELYEQANAWAEAVRLWEALGRPLRQALALEQQALEKRAQQDDDPTACAALWDQAAALYAGMWQSDKAVRARREAARCRGEPFITVEVEYERLTVNTETTLRFTVRNEGAGAARYLVIRAAGEGFAGGVNQTQRLLTLSAGKTRQRCLHICPRRAGDHVQLQVALAYQAPSGETRTRQQVLAFEVAATSAERPATTQREVLSPLAFDDLEVRIFAREDRGYPVEFTLNGEQEFPRGYLAADLLPWHSEGDLQRDGARLFAALLADSRLREAWGQVCGHDQLRLRIRLRIDADEPELHAVPWELLWREGVLAANAATPFSRYLPLEQPWGQVVRERPIRVLTLVSNPADLEVYRLAPLDIERERCALEQACGEAGARAVHLDFLDPPVTLARLEDALRTPYHVVHYIGHGTFSQKRGQAALYMQDDAGNVQVVQEQELRAMIARQHHRPDLIVLAACQSAQRSTIDAFRGLAPQLVRAGAPAVVAMQAAVSIVTARQFSAAFYRNLLTHGIVDLAVNQARSLLLTAQRPDALMPVLFMRLKDGKLWEMRSGEGP